MIVGAPGSGKSTMAIALGTITGLPVFHMDHIHYKAGWIEREPDEKRRRANEIEAKARWIFDGALSSTYTNRCARADTVIWLDLPLTLRIGRILRRGVRYRGQTRPDMAPNCPEPLGLELAVYAVRTRHSGREKIAQAIADAPHLAVHHIRSAKGADTFLEWLQTA